VIKDTAPPTTPTNLKAVAVSSTQIDLSWTASKDNIGVAGYKIWPMGRVGSFNTTGIGYSHTGLTADTRYCYAVSAYDAAGNDSALSPQICATTERTIPVAETAPPLLLPPPPPPTSTAPIEQTSPPADVVSPTIPTEVRATPVSSAQIDLSWTASTDNVGVIAYIPIVTNSNSLDRVATMSYSHTNLTAGTRYCYTVLAYDAAGNSSTVSAQACATTNTVAPLTTNDTAAPSIPGNVAATAISSNQINLTWTASTDNVGVYAYKLTAYRNNTLSGVFTVTDINYSHTNLVANSRYCYQVFAYDAAGNNSEQTPQVCANTPSAADTQAPTAPTSLNASVISSSQVNLAWAGSTDNVGVQGYKLTAYRSGVLSGVYTVNGTNYSHTGLASATQYCYQVFAYDASGNNSDQTSQVCATTQSAAPAADTTPPSVPTGLSISAGANHEFSIFWSRSTDNIAVKGYKIFRDGLLIASTNSDIPSYYDYYRTAGTRYCYKVSAYDAASNASAQSAEKCATAK
jgi:chitodextrinase